MLQTVHLQPLTLSGVALRLQLSYSDTEQTVRRLVQSGRVQYGDYQHNTGGRPARLLCLTPSTTASWADRTLAALANWPRARA